MSAPQVKSVYTVKDFENLGFHDCFIHGIRWDNSTYALILDLDYIFQWIENDRSFKFWVAPAELLFEFSSEVKILMDWSNLAMECQIQELHKREFSKAPNGDKIFRWEVEFFNPHGSIELWSADFELKILAEPKLLPNQRLRGNGPQRTCTS